jgi:predicted type IV restriction endonuclease
MPAGQYVNEAAISTGVVLPILNDLGWPVFDPTVVAPEFTVEGRRVDFALCHPRTKPAVFIEVKQPGKSEGADRQLFEYAFHLGIPLAVLTDGREWHFYLPAGQGQYQERRVYKLDLIERDIDEAEARLTRYLAYSAVTSGAAQRAAQDDYAGLRKDREIAATVPVAWRKLLDEKDELLVDLISDQVESLCGYKPDPDVVTRFLTEQARSLPATTTPPAGNAAKSPPKAQPVAAQPRPAPVASPPPASVAA